MKYKAVQTGPEHIRGVVALQSACFPPPFPSDCLWQAAHVENHLRLFPAGQFVCEYKDEVWASCTNFLVSNTRWNSHLSWAEITGGLDLNMHDPRGGVLYGIDISVHPNHRRKGLAKALYQKRFELTRQLGLSQYGTVCRVPDYLKSRHSNLANYIQDVVDQKIKDRTLTPLLKMGLTQTGIIEDYIEDQESGNAGIVLEWHP